MSNTATKNTRNPVSPQAATIARKGGPRFRLLPVVIFCGVLMLSVRLNGIWGDVTKPRKVDDAPPGISFAQTKAVAQDSQNSTEDDGALTMSDAETNGAAAAAPVYDYSTFTQSELDVLQNLAERREMIDAREREIEHRMALLKAAEKRIDRKISKLKDFEQQIKELLGQYEEKEEKKIEGLVKLYTTMKPKDAARIFNQLEMDILLTMFDRMNPRKGSAILAEMDSGKAKSLTSEIAIKNTMPGQ